MRYGLTALFACWISFHPVHGQEGNSVSLKGMNVHGKVRSITEKYYELRLKNGDIKKGNLLSTTVYTFNESGDLVEEAKKSVDSWSKQELATAAAFAYDSAGRLIQQSSLRNGTLISRYVYRYNEKGALSGLTQYSPDGGILLRQDFKMDDRGRTVEVLWYSAGGNELSNKVFYRYDDMGNPVECMTANKEGKIYSRKYFKYDTSGRKIEEKEYIDQKQISWNAYKYDRTGICVESTSFYENGVAFSSSRFRVEYDKNENWTSLMLFVSGQPGFLYERTIKYQ